ncbi:MAG: histidinol dehydrogenase [Flavobacteriales bacterium]|jgi:histidinol dehydrogenase|tara:strand:- start:889 stop:2178 length:1290 start_codon:yes stop_codon:yes gene_type:complete
MNKYYNPHRSTWAKLIKRPSVDSSCISKTIDNVFDLVEKNGDEAVKLLTKKYDNIELSNIRVSEDEIENSINYVDDILKESIDIAFNNIYKFHKNQLIQSPRIETSRGVVCWQEKKPIESVGFYIPGGSAPLFSTVLMLGIPSMIAGCTNTVICTPPSIDGRVNSIILYVAKLCNINEIYLVGGAQAIAAMTFGTSTIPKVNKIFGPGNQYVTAAKIKSLQFNTSIDMPAGPSELLVVGDDSSNASFIASDLLSQAEHGSDSQVMFVSLSKDLMKMVESQIEIQKMELSRIDFINDSILNSKLIYFENENNAIDFINEYSPEHYIICLKNEDKFVNKINNAGSVFIGNYSPESAGDYASGTNHTLPTNGYAKQYSGVSVDSFLKTITFQKISKIGLLGISKAIETMAIAEGLEAHKNSVSIRIKNLQDE